MESRLQVEERGETRNFASSMMRGADAQGGGRVEVGEKRGDGSCMSAVATFYRRVKN